MVPAAARLDTLSANANDLPTAAGLAANSPASFPCCPSKKLPVIKFLSRQFLGCHESVSQPPYGSTDWPDLAAKCAALAESGDLAQAIEMMDKAEGAKPSALSGWRDRAAKRIALEAALEETSQAVLRQITSMGATP
jgi:hypothetical protein